MAQGTDYPRGPRQDSRDPVELWARWPHPESEIGRAVGRALGTKGSDLNPGLVFDKLAGVLSKHAFDDALDDPKAKPNLRLKDQKSEVLKRVEYAYGKWAEGERRLLEAIAERGREICDRWGTAGGTVVLRFEGTLRFRVTSRLGAAHPFELGFMWHPTLGVPYLPGSGFKGAVRYAYWARYVAEAQAASVELQESLAIMQALFGTADPEISDSGNGDRVRAKPTDRDDAAALGENRRGLAVFLDVFPPAKARLAVDILNPHFSNWYQDKGVESDSDNPIPNFFLAIGQGGTWRFDVLLSPGTLDLSAVDREECRSRLEQATRDCLELWGVGAKTAAGYGLFDLHGAGVGGGRAGGTSGDIGRAEASPLDPANDTRLAPLRGFKSSDFGQLGELVKRAEAYPEPQVALEVLGARIREIWRSDKAKLKAIRAKYAALVPYLG